jgi:hypothetical protein
MAANNGTMSAAASDVERYYRTLHEIMKPYEKSVISSYKALAPAFRCFKLGYKDVDWILLAQESLLTGSYKYSIYILLRISLPKCLFLMSVRLSVLESVSLG